MEAPEHPDYPKKTTVDIVIDGESMTVHPYLLKGGQRLLFCDDVTQLVVNALLESKSIDINLGRRTLHLVSANFGAIYSSFVDSK